MRNRNPKRRPNLESLEMRLFLSASDPSGKEQETLELINRMRQNPAAELPLLENSTDTNVQGALKFFSVSLTDLASQWATLVAVPPLAWNADLATSALGHDNLMEQYNDQSHQITTAPDGTVVNEPDFTTRDANAGYTGYSSERESIFIAATSVFEAHAAFAVDWGSTSDGIQNPPGHRENIMASDVSDVGVAIITGPGNGTQPGPLVVTEDFGHQFSETQAYLLGSVFNDNNADGFYESGEGVAGVNVHIVGTNGTTGTYDTTTLTAGGYQIHLPPGTYSETFSGGSLVDSKTIDSITVGAANVQQDLIVSPPTITSVATTTFTTGTASSFTVQTTGSNLTLSEIGSLPQGVSFTDNGNGTAALSGTPAAATGANYVLALTANNGQTADTQTFTLTVNQAPSFIGATSTSFTAGVANSFTIHTNGFPVPTLSASGTFPAGVSFIDNHDGTGTITGTPAANSGGQDFLTITAKNAAKPSGSFEFFTLTVNAPPLVVSANNTQFIQDVGGSFTIATTARPTAAITETGTLPAGITLHDNGDGTATLSGTPTATPGLYPITITAANNISPNATQAFTLTVGVAPTVISLPAATFAVGTAGSFTVTTTGFPTPTITDTVTLPTGLTLTNNGNGTATISGTPAPNTGGIYTENIRAHNSVLPNFNQPFTLTIDQAPVITSANDATFQTGSTGIFTVTATGLPAPTFSAKGMPTGVLLNATTGQLSGSPTPGHGGIYTIKLRAGNGIGAKFKQSFTLTVNDPPKFTGTNIATFSVGTTGFATISTTGFPLGNITNTGALPAGVTFHNNGNGTATLSGIPAAMTGKQYLLPLVAKNGFSPNARETFTLKVNQAPLISSANNATFTAGTFATFTVSTVGFPAPAVANSSTLPTGLTFHDNGNGSATLSGTPAPDSGGAYKLSLSAINSVGANGSQKFHLTINQPAAITSAAAATFRIGHASSFTIQTTGFPIAILSESGALPTGILFTDNGNGSATLSGTPAAGIATSYVLTLKAKSGVLPTARQTFTLTVTGS